jgi:tetratricopeptide (TPR) repeat protein
MSTNASRRIARLVLAVAACLAIDSLDLRAQLATSPSQPATRRLSRSEHLREWLQAIEHHQPGRDDEAIGVLESWRPDDFQYLAIDVGTLLAVMKDPSLRTFYWKVEGRSSPLHVVYSGSDLRLILELAKAANARDEDRYPLPVERMERNRNHIVKRAAILHGDVAAGALIGSRTKGSSAPEGLQEFTLQIPDGRSQGLVLDVGQWELARSMLDKVVPAPARDEFVRQWYYVTAAYLQSLGQLTPSHFTRGLRLFPDDAELLFQAGCLHESLAESRVQEAMQTAAIPSDVKFEIASRRTELRDAESLLRKALKAQPDHLEARIRLARVLGLRGEHADAEALLRKAVADAKEPLLQYYAQLFLGAEKEALGDRDQARDFYGRAAVLYPDAQSPRLALSLLSVRDGNPAAALDTMSAVLARRGDTRVDPWWNYHAAQGRNAIADLAALYDRFLDEDRR